MSDKSLSFKFSRHRSLCELNFMLNGFSACHDCNRMLTCSVAIKNLNNAEVVRVMRDTIAKQDEIEQAKNIIESTHLD